MKELVGDILLYGILIGTTARQLIDSYGPGHGGILTILMIAGYLLTVVDIKKIDIDE